MLAEIVTLDPNQLSEIVVVLDQVRFLGHVTAISVAFGCGLVLWRLVVLAKNQRHMW